MRSSLVVISCLVLALACSSKKQPAAESEEQSVGCEENSDCERGEVCLDGECASTAPGAIYTDPSHAVTPDKVKAEVERINEKAQKRSDEMLDDM